MHLVIFDIDGTLTQTVKVDEECFACSLDEVFGFKDVDMDWSHYQHTTDSSIVHEIHEARTGRAPSLSDIERFRNHFLSSLAKASSEAPFNAVSGAPQLLSQLIAGTEYRVALATGAWRDSARLKMASAGLRYDDYPAASGDDAFERESIITVAIQRATARYGNIGRIIYVGDGVWDARACRNLGIPFIGIATNGRAARLVAEGAIRVFPDLSNAALFCNGLSGLFRTHEILT
jgi:phosphoglycolate phosphatase-like HAD superfamily hydrolase